MSIEQKINYQLNKIPWLKTSVKRIYQLGMYAISPKIKCEGNIIRVSPDEPGEYFFGYYDKSPWDASGRYMLCMKAKDTWSDPDPNTSVDILLIDLKERHKTRKIATSKTWNVQQGCMAQWLGPDYSNRIIYNDLREGKYCSIILNIMTGKEERIIGCPVYSVSADGKTALSLDFSRLHNLRKGYGYSAILEQTKGIPIPDATAIWKIDLLSGEVSSLFKYTDFANFEPRPEMIDSVHKVNHIMISPGGNRFMVLHRWFHGVRKYTRLVTCNIDGTKMYNLSDDDMVSHCFWKNNREIIAFANKHNKGTGYFIMNDRSHEYKRVWPNINNDGHPSYSPANSDIVVFDTYPDRIRLQKIKIGKDIDNEASTIITVFSPFKYDNDCRCDLHPRWSRDGKYICFDSVFEGKRGLYITPMDNPNI